MARLRRIVPSSVAPWLFTGVALLATGCSDDPADNFIAVILGSVLALLCVGLGLFSYFGAMLTAGAISTQRNLKTPTAKSKRWGYVIGGLNLLNGVGATALMVMAINNPDPPEDASQGMLYIAIGMLLAFGVGAVTLWAAVKAES